MLKEALFRLAKSPLMGRAVGLAFRWCPWALPVEVLLRGRRVIALRHPRPCYDAHVILSPRRPVATLLQLRDLPEIWSAAQEVASRGDYAQGFSLVANGGRRQEVQQVHFHLFAGHRLVRGRFCPDGTERLAHANAALRVLEPTQPEWEAHLMLVPQPGVDGAAYLAAVPDCLRQQDALRGLTAKGCSLVHQRGEEQGLPVFHIVAGKRLNA